MASSKDTDTDTEKPEKVVTFTDPNTGSQMSAPESLAKKMQAQWQAEKPKPKTAKK